MKHKHHKIPRHAGGTDDPSNIEELTIQEHAEAHRQLFLKHGRWQDRAAWHFLLGLAPVENARRIASEEGKRAMRADPVRLKKFSEAVSAGLRRSHSQGLKVWNHGKTGLVQISENTKRQAREGNFHNIGDYQRGRKFDEDHKEKLKARALQRKRIICEHCDSEVTPAMFTRWHGPNCKRRR